jgi:Glycosyltransferase
MRKRSNFTGFISEQELADTYATSDALVLPSEYETYGQVVVEALNYGTPVVMTPVGIGPERIEVRIQWCYLRSQ